MKRVLKNFLIVLVALVASLVFNRVYAEDDIVTCSYGTIDITINRTTKKVSVPENNQYHATTTNKLTYDDMIINDGTGDRCADYITFQVISRRQSVEFVYSTMGGTKYKLTGSKGVCVSINDRTDLLNRIENIKEDMQSLINQAQDKYSIISTKPTANNVAFIIKELPSDTTCEELDKYKLYYFNKLDTTIEDKANGNQYKRLKYLADRITNTLAEVESTSLCHDSARSDAISLLTKNLERMKNIYYASENAALEQVAEIHNKNKCDGDPYAIYQTVKEEKTELNKYLKESLIGYYRFEWGKNDGCGLISGDLKYFLNNILWYIKVIAIVLAIILSLVDYVKAAAGSDDKSMSNANKRFMTRLILVVILFLLPVLITFVLNVLNISDATSASINCLK